jgi:hypothetical protein
METMILTSLVTDKQVSTTLPPDIFETQKIPNPLWNQYDFDVISLFKAHWINGVNMYSRLGQYELAHNSCVVCAASDIDTDFAPLLEEYKSFPPNTIVFDASIMHQPKYPFPKNMPGVIPRCFVTSYSSFMKLVILWKWIDTYSNECSILEHDTTIVAIERIMCKHNIQYVVLNRRYT